MTEAQTYDKCLEKMAQVCSDNKKVYEMTLTTPGFSLEMVVSARKVMEQAEEVMREFVSLRLAVI